MQQTEDPGAALAHRLRSLRESHWPDLHLTQGQLAEALSVGKPVSAPAISSWENRVKIPPPNRLEAYATFFATRRSVSDGTPRLLSEAELTDEENEHREQLQEELIRLRAAALMDPRVLARIAEPGSPRAEPLTAAMWDFPDLRPVTIVCALLPERLRRAMPYADPHSPDYIESYTFADVDALIELFGHIRAVNPLNQVEFRRASEVTQDHYTNHLVLLGGVDWNDVTREMQALLDVPVRQLSTQSDDPARWDAWFEVGEGDKKREFRPRLAEIGGHKVLREDVAHFFRAPNPFNHKRTITVCNGMYGRGTYGAVRALTDAKFRDRNDEYVHSRFEGSDTFSILMRVHIAGGKVITPDWTRPSTRLHEWPEAGR
jgi:hypothetical protein